MRCPIIDPRLGIHGSREFSIDKRLRKVATKDQTCMQSFFSEHRFICSLGRIEYDESILRVSRTLGARYWILVFD